jgi:hypothetical protein
MFSQDFSNLLTAVIGNPTVARRRTSDDRAAKAFDTAMHLPNVLRVVNQSLDRAPVGEAA